MSVRVTILQVEELGQRILPSVSPLGPGSFGHAIAITDPLPPVHTHHHALAGSGSGTYTVSPLLVDSSPQPASPGHAQPQFRIIVGDVGDRYDFTGVADLARLGNVTVSGSIHNPGFVATGHATGSLTFTNANGSVTISLTGPSQPGFSRLPTSFQYRVTGGTGEYQNVHDHGTLSLVLIPAPAGGTAQGTVPSSQGAFTLTIP
jgi:hypothetical protein